jgi:hypothetical protein
MECGARLPRPSGALAIPDTGEVPALPPGAHPMFDPTTGQLVGMPRSSRGGSLPPPGADGPPTPAAGELPPPVDDDATNVLPAIGPPMTTFAPPDPTPGAGLPWQTYLGPPTAGQDYPAFPGSSENDPTRVQAVARADDATGIVPADYRPSAAPVRYERDPVAYAAPVRYDQRFDDVVGWEAEQPAGPLPGQTFRIKPMLVLAVLAAVAAGIAMVADVATIEPAIDGQPTWKLNDFGTNLTVAGVVLSLAMIGGALAWCTGFRWGAGLAGGAGLGLAGWAALAVGAAETTATSNWPPAGPLTTTLTRQLGYWGLAAAGGLGVLVLLVSLLRAGNDRRAGLDPWVAALGAIATLAAAIGPLIPLNDANLDLNWSSPPGADWPTAYFAARFVCLGLLLVGGVVGFLLVSRYGLGLAIGSSLGLGWLTLTAATEQTDRPIGPAYWNPGSADTKPYVVTVAGIGLLLFFGVVAAAMALIDND